jgi:hypothetical protein
MEAICSSEKSVDFQRTIQRYIPEDSTLHNHCSEYLQSYMLLPKLSFSKIDEIAVQKVNVSKYQNVNLILPQLQKVRENTRYLKVINVELFPP